MRINSPKNFGTGLMLVAIALAFGWKSLDYRLGTAASMGPGYFPLMLSIVLGVIGLLVLAKGVLVEGEALESIPWKPLLIVTGSTVAFGLLLVRVGLPLALLVFLFASAAASRRFALGWLPTAGALLVIAFCYVIFVLGLAIPLPVRGSWL